MQMKTFNVYDNGNKAVKDAYEMLTANIHINNDNKQFKTFVLTSCNPEEGKTSIAISLAVTMAHSGRKVLLVDADMRKPTAAKRLNTRVRLGLSDYLEGEIELDEALCETNITNLTYLSCGNDHRNPIALLCSQRFKELMDIVKIDYDIIIFDTPALTSVVDGAIVASRADAALLVVKMGVTTLTSLKRIKEQLEILKVNLLGVVLNKVKKSDYKFYFRSYNYFFNTNKFLKNKKAKRIILPVDEKSLQNTIEL